MAPSNDETVRRRQRDMQQIIALVEGHAQPDPTHPVEPWHHQAADIIDDAFVTVARQRQAAAQVETEAPLSLAEMQRMVWRTKTLLQIVHLLSGRPDPVGIPRPGRRHRAIAAAIQAMFARHDGPLTTPLTTVEPDPRPEVPPTRDAAPRDPAVKRIPRAVQAHIPDRPIAMDDQAALVRAVKTALVFGQPYMKQRVMETVGARCVALGLCPDQIKQAQEAAGLVTAGFNPRSLAQTAASLDARGATPYQKAVGLTSDVMVTMVKLHKVRLSPDLPRELERKVAALTGDPAAYLELYALVTAVESPTAPTWVALPPNERGWRADAAAIIRDVARADRR